MRTANVKFVCHS